MLFIEGTIIMRKMPLHRSIALAFSITFLGLAILPVTLASAEDIVATGADCVSEGCDLAQTVSIRQAPKPQVSAMATNPVIVLSDANLALVDADRLTPAEKIGSTLRMVHCSGTKACQIAWLECAPLPGAVGQLKCSAAR